MSIKLRLTLKDQAHFYSYKLRLHKNALHFLPKFRGRILDIGSGMQPYRSYLSEDVEYVAMDISEANSPDVVGNVLEMQLDSDTFDAVIFTEVLEHVPDPLKALQNINRVIKRGGQLYLTAPMTWGLHYEPSDYFRFTKYGLVWLLNQSGFTVIETERMGGLFTVILARLEDIGMSMLYRLGFPLKLILGNSTRIHAISIAMFPIIILLDGIATVMDFIIPRANEDTLGWAILAVKRDLSQ